jgi:hypothetical protein
MITERSQQLIGELAVSPPEEQDRLVLRQPPGTSDTVRPESWPPSSAR